MDGEPDGALARKAKLGDKRAFETLVRRHKGALYGFVHRYVGDGDDAYDVIQESFVSAWRAIGRFDPERPFATWMRAIALNKCRDLSRRASVRRLFLRAFAQSPPERANDGSASETEQRAERLDRAIAKLPGKYKEPLLLTTVGDLSHREAARLLGLSSKAVEMRLYRARQRLSAILAEGEG